MIERIAPKYKFRVIGEDSQGEWLVEDYYTNADAKRAARGKCTDNVHFSVYNSKGTCLYNTRKKAAI